MFRLAASCLCKWRNLSLQSVGAWESLTTKWIPTCCFMLIDLWQRSTVMMEHFIVFMAQRCTSCQAKWVTLAPCTSLVCVDVCLPAVVLMVLRHQCLYQISLCACVSYNKLIPFPEGRNICYRFNSFSDFLYPDLIDGYTGERAALEEQLHQKEELHLSLERELQVRL